MLFSFRNVLLKMCYLIVLVVFQHNPIYIHLQISILSGKYSNISLNTGMA